ncbi:putative F-box/kelch-repeat protein-like isoform X2 [Capsicum annuum]|nr:putative F-box/kelch-repeat protein-like isoform X2 [Capsicum annuum]
MWGSSLAAKCGFGYDESHDDYKAQFISCCRNSSHHVVTIHSLRSDSWTTVHEHFQGIFLINRLGKYVNGKLYWSSSTGISTYIVSKIISFDLADETWGSVALPFCGQDKSNFKLGVMGIDLSLIYTCHSGATTTDVWILKDCSSWTKLFTIKFPQRAGPYLFPSPIYTFSMHFCESNKGDILILNSSFIMIIDGSTRKLEHNADVEVEEIYLESLVSPLTISDQGRR